MERATPFLKVVAHSRVFPGRCFLSTSKALPLLANVLSSPVASPPGESQSSCMLLKSDVWIVAFATAMLYATAPPTINERNPPPISSSLDSSDADSQLSIL